MNIHKGTAYNLLENLKQNIPEWQISDSAILRFRESLPSIIATINDKFRIESNYAENQAMDQYLDFLIDSHRYFGEMLLAIYQFHLWHDLIDEAIWYAQSISSRGLDENYLARMLKAWMIAMYSYIKPSEANELCPPLNWLSKNVHELFQFDVIDENINSEASQLLEMLLQNKMDDAENLVRSFFDRYNSEDVIITELFAPVLSEIGRRWSKNMISVADEHLAVANLRIIYHAFFRSHSPKIKIEQKIAICCVPGEEHEIGAELLSLYLQNKGWNILFIGHSAPESEIIRMIDQNKPFAVILSITLISHLPALKSLIMELRRRFPALIILAGGSRFNQAREVIKKLADASPDSLEECHQILKEMLKSNA